ncbi:o-succinylbenzoate--CoA ligase [Polycladomyces subterraneus]|uniref:O-succinylbenzoate--CoA ligase n=1 Tax=Polycladomyces subterraneus TaxID=1016997 RepID=A0ABT8IJW7_9BACL|nr:o-succinylbenzoate--CoA ligase [Polycladomyces subterraneus]MDN4593062.1 o-succinylbenzoate--CoA ligase [Polycladomyces subterraneus]
MNVGGIGSWLTRRAEISGEKTALIFPGGSYTYSQLNRRVNRLAHALLQKGVRKGDRVAGILLNTPHFIEVLFACAKIGAIFVPVNFRLSPQEVKTILQDAGVHVAFYHTHFTHLLQPIRWETEVLHGIYVTMDPALSGMESDLEYEELIKGADDSEPGVHVGLEDIHLMMFTSGTTGKPKGAMLSHGNTVWNAINVFLSEINVESNDIILTVAPLFHIGGLNILTTPALYKGATVVLLPRFDPEEVIRTIDQEKITLLFLVPAMWAALMQSSFFDPTRLSSLRTLISGGAPCPLPVIRFYQDRGFCFLEGYGMTETAPSAMILGNADATRKNGSVGRPCIHVEARIVDDWDRDVPPGEIGELVLRGPNICKGYWNNITATEEAFRGGWFHTGDLARQDEEGFYYLVDRKKDMLISGGENIYPTEVEQVLYQHPNIREVAVIGIPDEKWGEIPMAVVALKEGAQPIDLKEIQDFCQGKLAKYKIPKRLRFVDELPRNATGKVLKRMLREEEIKVLES